MSWRLSVPFFLPTLLPAGRPFPWAGRYSPHSSLTLHILLYRNDESLSSFFCAYLQLFCCHYHRDLKCQDKNAESIIMCLKYYFRLSPPLNDYTEYAMAKFSTWVVAGVGVEPTKTEKPISVLILVYTNGQYLSSEWKLLYCYH